MPWGRGRRPKLLEGTDACFTPVLTIPEAIEYPHNVERGGFVEVDGVPQPAPVPRFTRTPSAAPSASRDLDRKAATDLLGSWKQR